MQRLRGLLICDSAVILSTIFFGIISYVIAFFDSDGNNQARIAGVWARILLFGCGIKVVVEGLEQIDPAGSYIFAANHLSYMDTPTIMASIRVQFRFLAKSGLFKIPFIGGHLKRGGHIAVPLDDPRASVKTMQTAAEVIKTRKISLLIFPEGGRAEDGVLQPFKEGAAYIAIKAGVPVVPVVLIGTQIVLPFGGAIVQPGIVTLRILKPIPTDKLILKDRTALTNQLRELIAQQLEAEGFETHSLQLTK